MNEEKQCLDFYGEILKVGDEVIPMMSEFLRLGAGDEANSVMNGTFVLGIGGKVTDIYYNEKYDTYYMTIADEKGNTILESVNSRYYTTKERYEEREKEKRNSVYFITFYDKKFNFLNYIPLTGKTKLDYKMLQKSYLITITARHRLNKYQDSYPIIYTVAVTDGLVVTEYGDGYYIDNLESQTFFKLNGKEEFKLLKNQKELQQYITALIEYFTKADLSCVNVKEYFEKNLAGQDFERQLIRQLKK